MSDIRKQRTLKHIDQAIFGLLKEMSFSDIKVTSICQRAELGRSTFYQYYFDKYEWLEHQVQKYNDRLTQLLDKRFVHHNLFEELNSLMESLWPDHEQLTLLFKVHTPEADLTESFQKILIQHFIKNMPRKEFEPDEFSFLSNIYGSIAVTNIKWSMQHGISNKINHMLDESLAVLLSKH